MNSKTDNSHYVKECRYTFCSNTEIIEFHMEQFDSKCIFATLEGIMQLSLNFNSPCTLKPNITCYKQPHILYSLCPMQSPSEDLI